MRTLRRAIRWTTWIGVLVTMLYPAFADGDREVRKGGQRSLLRQRPALDGQAAASPAFGAAPYHHFVARGDDPTEVSPFPIPGLVRITATEFFAACPNVQVPGDTIVRGSATLDSDCTVELANAADLSFVDMQLSGAGLTVNGTAESGVTFGDEDCLDAIDCASSTFNLVDLTVELIGEDVRMRMFNTRVTADSIAVSLDGEDALARLQAVDLDAINGVTVQASGLGARTRVRVANEELDRSRIVGSNVLLESLGTDSATRVLDVDFDADGVTIRAEGEVRVQGNDFGAATVQITATECDALDNVPATECLNAP